MEYLYVIFKTVFFYFYIILIYRMMGKREIGELGIIDLIISFLIADIATIGIEERNHDMLMAALPIVFLTILQISIAKMSLKKIKFRNMIDGKPTVIIDKGIINKKEMKKQRYNINDLVTQLREQGVNNIDEVEYAVLETNGRLSVFPYRFLKFPWPYPIPVIINGQIDNEVLVSIKKDQVWIMQQLDNQNLSLDMVFYGYYKSNKLHIITNNHTMN